MKKVIYIVIIVVLLLFIGYEVLNLMGISVFGETDSLAAFCK